MLAGTLKDGFPVTVSFGAHPNLNLYLDPKSTNPPGMDVGEAIDTTTQSNATYRTSGARVLSDLSNGSFTAAYDPDGWATILAAINSNNLITMEFPNGDALAFYGFLKSFIPSAMTEGEMPTAECEIVVTNIHSTTGVETAPVLTENT